MQPRIILLFLVFNVSKAFQLPSLFLTKGERAKTRAKCTSRFAEQTKKNNGAKEPQLVRDGIKPANGEQPATRKSQTGAAKKNPFLTYESGNKRVRFTIDQSDPTFQSSSRFRRNVILPNEDEEKSAWKQLIEAINNKTPTDWNLLRYLENAKQTRLLKNRAYAKPEPFAANNILSPPGLRDLSPPKPLGLETFWITTPARMLSFGVSYAIFPYLTRFLDHFVTMPNDDLNDITSKFGPGISILYGTFISLTLSILYGRVQQIQDDVAVESATLVYATRNLLALFRSQDRLALEAGQCSADQIRTLVKGSRGGELILLMYSDPYARMLELVQCFEDQLIAEGKSDLAGKGALISSCRDSLKDLFQQRANRLSNEALALPSTHFFILQILTGLIFLSYATSTLPTVDYDGSPSVEASLIFACIANIYIVFYSFANDLNNPFSGVYQVRRSATASHLLELKWLIGNHPQLRGKVNFEEVQDCDTCEDNSNDVVMVRSPGLGSLIFNREDLYPDREKVWSNTSTSCEPEVKSREIID